MVIGSESGSGHILPCTKKCLIYYYDGLKTLLNLDKDNCLSTKDYNLFLKAEKLLAKMPVFTPQHKIKQKVIKIGSGAQIKIDKQEPVWTMLDGILVLKNDFLEPDQQIITTSSPLGRFLLNKEIGQSGKFKVSNKIHSVEIINILPYEEIKHLFFPKTIN